MKYQYESNGNGSEDLGIGKTVWLDLIMVEDVDKVSNEEFSTTQHKGGQFFTLFPNYTNLCKG